MQLQVHIGILTGEEKRSLECYIDQRYFQQRKSYDEYYLNSSTLEAALNMTDLMILAEDFKVRVHSDSVELSSLM